MDTIIIYLHGTRDTLSIAENLVQIFGTQNIPQCRLSQQPFFCGEIRVAYAVYELGAVL